MVVYDHKKRLIHQFNKDQLFRIVWPQLTVPDYVKRREEHEELKLKVGLVHEDYWQDHE